VEPGRFLNPLGLKPAGNSPLKSSSNLIDSSKDGRLAPPIFLGVGVRAVEGA
jgi:hypothetical protein